MEKKPKKIVKLAVIRSNDDTPCPFGLSIPFACKSAGELINNMAPVDVMEDMTEEEQASVAKANKHLLMWKNPEARCIYAGKLFKENEVVECNWMANDAGTTQRGALVGSPFYYKHYSGIGLDGLYSYPLGYYTDNSIDRGMYYGMYSIESAGESDNTFGKYAQQWDNDFFVVRTILSGQIETGFASENYFESYEDAVNYINQQDCFWNAGPQNEDLIAGIGALEIGSAESNYSHYSHGLSEEKKEYFYELWKIKRKKHIKENNLPQYQYALLVIMKMLRNRASFLERYWARSHSDGEGDMPESRYRRHVLERTEYLDIQYKILQTQYVPEIYSIINGTHPFKYTSTNDGVWNIKLDKSIQLQMKSYMITEDNELITMNEMHVAMDQLLEQGIDGLTGEPSKYWPKE